MKHLRTRIALVVALAGVLYFSVSTFIAQAHDAGKSSSVKHVLLISVDGLHAVDLARYVRLYPNSALAQLSKWGVTYDNASTSKPSDSYPGLLSIVTGGSPRSTGVYYDDSYDRNLSAPGSKCATVGTEVVYDETIDKNLNAIDGGGAIDPNALPLDPAKGCTPVYPHSFLRVNTIFEVAHEAGLHTAWSDKHLSYELVDGPSGKGVDDLYTPEIASVGGSEATIQAYDALKVKAILNEIAGKDHNGTKSEPVPAIFGMNFQAVSVGQKLATGGYTDSLATPSSTLLSGLNFVDQSLGAMVNALRAHDLLNSTVIIVTAKHGQSPIDPNKVQRVSNKIIPALVESVQTGLLAQATQDDVALLWLTDQSKTDAVVAKLAANEDKAHIQEIISGDQLKLLFGDPTKDSRIPDIVVLPQQGVIYAGASATKIAEHGGFSDADTNVALLVANPRLEASQVSTAVQTTEIAPTILQLLGLDAQKLKAVRQEKTQELPGIDLD